MRTAASVWGALRRGTDWRTREGSRGRLVFGDLLRRPWDSGERGTCDCDVTVKAPPGRGQGGPDTEPSPWGVGTAAGPAHAPRAHRPLPSPASGHPGSIGPQCTLGHVTGPAPAPAPWGEVQSPHHPRPRTHCTSTLSHSASTKPGVIEGTCGKYKTRSGPLGIAKVVQVTSQDPGTNSRPVTTVKAGGVRPPGWGPPPPRPARQQPCPGQANVAVENSGQGDQGAGQLEKLPEGRSAAGWLSREWGELQGVLG